MQSFWACEARWEVWIVAVDRPPALQELEPFAHPGPNLGDVLSPPLFAPPELGAGQVVVGRRCGDLDCIGLASPVEEATAATNCSAEPGCAIHFCPHPCSGPSHHQWNPPQILHDIFGGLSQAFHEPALSLKYLTLSMILNSGFLVPPDVALGV